MKARILVVVYILAAAVAVTFQGCGRQDDVSSRTNAPPPLVIDTDAPLLLEESNKTEHTPTEAETKNATCYVCHANYAEEQIAQWHSKANYACSDCHGESIAHKNDENHTTPPDKMYPAGEIDPACQKCHTGHDVPAIEIVRRWKERTADEKTDVLCKECHESHDIPAAKVVRKWQKQSGQKEQADPIVCTDCHGNHRLKLRSVRWDKKTGKLLR